MRVLTSSLLIAAAIAGTGCGRLLSVQPLDTEDRAIFDSNLVGTWTDGKSETYIVRPDGPHAYSITLVDQNRAMQFRGLLFEIHGERVLDITAQDPPALTVACHAFVRLRVSSNRIELRFLDTDWLRTEASEARLSVLHGRDKAEVLTSPSEHVRAFIEQYVLDDRALGEPERLTRL